MRKILQLIEEAQDEKTLDIIVRAIHHTHKENLFTALAIERKRNELRYKALENRIAELEKQKKAG